MVLCEEDTYSFLDKTDRGQGRHGFRLVINSPVLYISAKCQPFSRWAPRHILWLRNTMSLTYTEQANIQIKRYAETCLDSFKICQLFMHCTSLLSLIFPQYRRRLVNTLLSALLLIPYLRHWSIVLYVRGYNTRLPWYDTSAIWKGVTIEASYIMNYWW